MCRSTQQEPTKFVIKIKSTKRPIPIYTDWSYLNFIIKLYLYGDQAKPKKETEHQQHNKPKINTPKKR